LKYTIILQDNRGAHEVGTIRASDALEAVERANEAYVVPRGACIWVRPVGPVPSVATRNLLYDPQANTVEASHAKQRAATGSSLAKMRYVNRNRIYLSAEEYDELNGVAR
jgi:1,2-phenylacetyl-CoA epoxidase PaaB subunit